MTRVLHAPGDWPGAVQGDRALCTPEITGPFASSAERVTCPHCLQWPAALAAAFRRKKAK